MNNTVIKLRDISKKRGQTEILNHLNMTVYQKDIYGFIGQNGAGKSTTMKIIMSLIKETQGQLELFDTLDNQINRSRIGAIIENPAFYPYMTAYENLKYYIQYKGIVEINGLDPQGIVELREILSHLNKKYGITMLISSHILDELEMIATRYGFIHQGQMIEEITAEKLQEKLKKYISLDVENIGLASITLEQKLHTENFKVMDDHTIYLYDFVNESSQVATTLIQEGVILNKMNISNVSLENYYLSLIKGVESHV